MPLSVRQKSLLLKEAAIAFQDTGDPEDLFQNPESLERAEIDERSLFEAQVWIASVSDRIEEMIGEGGKGLRAASNVRGRREFRKSFLPRQEIIIAFHATPTERIDDIISEGLTPPVFFTTRLGDAIAAMEDVSTDVFSETGGLEGTDMTIFRFPIRRVDIVSDPESGEIDLFFTRRRIPADDLSVVGRFVLDRTQSVARFIRQTPNPEELRVIEGIFGESEHLV